MSSGPAIDGAAHRRSQRYVDQSVQLSLVIVMVGLELILVSVSIWVAYQRLADLIDSSMYRMILSPDGLTLMRLSQEAFPVMGGFVALNLLGLSAAVAIWEQRRKRVLRDLVMLTEKTRALDFSVDATPVQEHEVLALALAWRARERSRFIALREQVQKIEAALTAKAGAAELQSLVCSARELLN